jgi:hypothetical protein
MNSCIGAYGAGLAQSLNIGKCELFPVRPEVPCAHSYGWASTTHLQGQRARSGEEWSARATTDHGEGGEGRPIFVQ